MKAYLALAARIIVGGILIVAGALKVGHFDDLAATIAQYRLLPQPLIPPLAVGLPIFELLLGGYVLVGLYTRVAASLALVEFLVFAAAIASVVVRGIPAPCGCFGPGDASVASWGEVARDLGFAVVALIAVLGAPGAFSLDRRIHPPS